MVLWLTKPSPRNAPTAETSPEVHTSSKNRRTAGSISSRESCGCAPDVMLPIPPPPGPCATILRGPAEVNRRSSGTSGFPHDARSRCDSSVQHPPDQVVGIRFVAALKPRVDPVAEVATQPGVGLGDP